TARADLVRAPHQYRPLGFVQSRQLRLRRAPLRQLPTEFTDQRCRKGSGAPAGAPSRDYLGLGDCLAATTCAWAWLIASFTHSRFFPCSLSNGKSWSSSSHPSFATSAIRAFSAAWSSGLLRSRSLTCT